MAGHEKQPELPLATPEDFEAQRRARIEQAYQRGIANALVRAQAESRRPRPYQRGSRKAGR